MSIQEAEHAFILRDFHSALKLSNDILQSADKEEKSTMTVHVPYQHPISIPNIFSSRYNDSISSSNGTSELKSPMMAIRNPFVHTVSGKLSWLDRAAAVAIQSSYEIWKGQCLEDKDRDPMTKDRDSSALDKHGNLMRNLEPFLDAYSYDEYQMQGEGTDCCSYRRIMSLDLASIWIRFQHAVGFVGNSTLSSLEFLLSLLVVGGDDGSSQEVGWSRKNEEKEEMICESLCECTYDILDLILLRTLPFVEDVRMVEAITDELFMILMEPKNKKGDTRSLQSLHRKILTKPIKMKSHPIRQSLSTMYRSMEAIIECRREAVPFFLTDAIEECLEEGKIMMVQQLNPLIKKEKESFCTKERNTLIDETDGNIMNRTSDEDWSNFSKSDIIHALWDSENRWTNRGMVLAAGILTYATWKKRHRVIRSSRRIGSSIISPLHEIAGAVAVFKKNS
jgi:hypothetical protein